jgi:hypothetical protein
MPTVTLSLRSQRKKPVPDKVQFVDVRGRFSGQVQASDIDIRSDEIVLDLVPDFYTVDVEVNGFKAARGTMTVGKEAVARVFPLENRVTTLPTVSQFSAEQRRLLQTLDSTKTPAEIWAALTDNKAATFFQVSHALGAIPQADGSPLSSLVDRIVRVGGAELTAPDTAGVSRTVVGWRMHVVFVGGAGIEASLESVGFARDPGEAHPTHKRFGFARSFREKKGSPRLQVVTNHEGSGADVDLDAGVFHKSSPKDVFKAFVKRFPDVEDIYEVD